MLFLALPYIVRADNAYEIDNTNPSIAYGGRWHSEDDYDPISSYNGTLSNALQQDEATTASLFFYGTESRRELYASG